MPREQGPRPWARQNLNVEVSKEDTLEVIENADGTFTISWDEKDPRYDFLKDLTPDQITAMLEKSIQRMINDDESLLGSNE